MVRDTESLIILTLLISNLFFLVFTEEDVYSDTTVQFSLHPEDPQECEPAKYLYAIQTDTYFEVTIRSNVTVDHGWCGFGKNNREVYGEMSGQKYGVVRFKRLKYSNIGKSGLRCCVYFNKGGKLTVPKFTSNSTYLNESYITKCCTTDVDFNKVQKIEFRFDDRSDKCQQTNTSGVYNLKENQKINFTASNFNQEMTRCTDTNGNKEKILFNESDFQQCQSGTTSYFCAYIIENASSLKGTWLCKFKNGQVDINCSFVINIENNPAASPWLDSVTLYISIGVGSLFILIIIQTLVIIYFRNKAKRIAIETRLSNEIGGRNHEERVYSSPPGLRSVVNLKEQSRVESDIYETIDIAAVAAAERDISQRPPVPLPIDEDYYEDPEVVKATPFNAPLPIKPQPPSFNTLPGKKKMPLPEIPSDAKPRPAVPKTNKPVLPTPIKPKIAGLNQKADKLAMNELDAILRRRQAASGDHVPSPINALPPKPSTLTRPLKPTPASTKPPVPAMPLPMLMKPKTPVAAKYNKPNSSVANRFGNRPPLPNDHKPPPRPSKPRTQKPSTPEPELSDDSEFDEYDVLPDLSHTSYN